MSEGASPPPSRTWSRRGLLRGGAAVGGALALGPPSLDTISAARRTRAAGSDIGAIEHVVFLMQENRSFDHYFGAYKGVRGFNDRVGGTLGAFAQPYPENRTRAPSGVQLPFRLNTEGGQNGRFHDLSHDWLGQHLSWNHGAMDGFVRTHLRADMDGPDYGLLTMGYYTRADLPYHYALADAYTLCDNYHCSVFGPTDPNRIMALSGSIDPSGSHGGPIVTTSSSNDTNFSLTWVTVPELLHEAGVSWKTYTTPGQGYTAQNPNVTVGDATLQYFRAFRNPSTALYANAFTPAYPSDFVSDVATGALPAVSWIVPPEGFDEHPPSPSDVGAWFIDQVLRTLISNPAVWAKTVLFVTWDENDGLFDHVAPPTPPPGTAGEYLTQRPLTGAAQGVVGPIGLGFRVPMLVVSPFSAGGWVCSEIFDHTSQIRFLETRFGIRTPMISAWRRQTVGDLTSSLGATANVATPSLPATSRWSSQTETVDGTSPPVTPSPGGPTLYDFPSRQTMPTQESGAVRRVSLHGAPLWATLGPFAEGSTALTGSLPAQVTELAATIVANGNTNVHLVGYSDDVPSLAAGTALSRRRASRVASALRRELARLGHRSVTVSSTGAGSARPLAPNTTAAGRAANRRVLATGR